MTWQQSKGCTSEAPSSISMSSSLKTSKGLTRVNRHLSQTLSQEQDVTRTRAALEAFAAERGLAVAAWFVENESEASLKRPEPFRLLGDCNVLLIKQVDRLSRLNDPDREALKREIGARGMRSSTGLVYVLAEHRDHGRNHGLHPGRCDWIPWPKLPARTTQSVAGVDLKGLLRLRLKCLQKCGRTQGVMLHLNPYCPSTMWLDIKKSPDVLLEH